MPGRDGTGPIGLGPASGRAAGSCTGIYNNAFPFCRRMGMRRGMGHGQGFMVPSETEQLKAREQSLSSQLDAVRQRLANTKQDS